MDSCKKCCEINTVSLTCGFLQVLREIMTLSLKKWIAGNDVVLKQTSFNVCMHETKEVLQLLLVSPCYNFCSAKTQ